MSEPRKHRNASMPPLREVAQRIAYDPETGLISWKPCGPETFKSAHAWKVWTAKFAGKPIRKLSRGYVVVAYSGPDGTRYMQGHRIAWALMTGAWPAQEIDHINGRRSDNRWENLREATHTENNRHKAAESGSKTGVRGVYPHHDGSGRFIAQIRAEGRIKYLGTFDTKDAAAAARAEAARSAFGAFAGPGIAHIGD